MEAFSRAIHFVDFVIFVNSMKFVILKILACASPQVISSGMCHQCCFVKIISTNCLALFEKFVASKRLPTVTCLVHMMVLCNHSNDKIIQ